MGWTQREFRAASGRVLICETVSNWWDWKEFLQPLNVHIGGICSGKYGTDEVVCHVWRFVRRVDVEQICRSQHKPGEADPWTIDTPDIFAGVQASNTDCIMMVKHWISSLALAQPPFVAMPSRMHAELLKTCDGPERIAARNPLTDREVKEYTKTAGRVAEEPWNLTSAQEYLCRWVQRNVSRQSSLDSPLPMIFVIKGPTLSLAKAPVLPPPDLDLFASEPIKTVSVVKQKPPSKKQPPHAKAAGKNPAVPVAGEGSEPKAPGAKPNAVPPQKKAKVASAIVPKMVGFRVPKLPPAVRAAALKAAAAIPKGPPPAVAKSVTKADAKAVAIPPVNTKSVTKAVAQAAATRLYSTSKGCSKCRYIGCAACKN